MRFLIMDYDNISRMNLITGGKGDIVEVRYIC
jgi:hypothetical protein